MPNYRALVAFLAPDDHTPADPIVTDPAQARSLRRRLGSLARPAVAGKVDGDHPREGEDAVMRLRRESRNRPERYRGRRGDSSPRTDRVSQWRIRFTIARMPGTRGRRRDRRRQGLA